MSTTPPMLAPMPAGPYVSAHRGASSIAPENTLSAYREAYYHGADMLSIDVHRTRDGHLVVIHDATVDRTTNGHGWIKDMTLQQLQALDAGAWFAPRYAGERIRTLDEVLDWSHGRMRLDIEMKDPDLYPGIEQQLADAIHAHQADREVMVDSFDHAAAARFKALAPGVETGYLVAPGPLVRALKVAVPSGALLGLAGCVAGGLGTLGIAAGVLGGAIAGFMAGAAIGRHRAFAGAVDSKVDLVLPHWALLTKRRVGHLHKDGLAVVPYTENNRREVHRLLDKFGVDSIITDTPQRFDAGKRDAGQIVRERCIEALERMPDATLAVSGDTLALQAATPAAALALRGMLRPQVGPCAITVLGPAASPATDPVARYGPWLRALPGVCGITPPTAGGSWRVAADREEDVAFLRQLLNPALDGAALDVSAAPHKKRDRAYH